MDEETEAKQAGRNDGTGIKSSDGKASNAKASSAKASNAKASNAKASSAKTSESGLGIAGFLIGTREELTKVVWPSRQQLISESAAVILMVSLSATLIYLIDKLFGWASTQVF